MFDNPFTHYGLLAIITNKCSTICPIESKLEVRSSNNGIMKVLGIDPGIATTGFGVISKDSAGIKVLESGLILTSKTRTMEERLATIYNRIEGLIKKHKPDCCVVEQLFFNTNAKSALKVGQARGCVFLVASHNNVECFEYTPLQVKQAVVGYGRADKQQVQYMVKQILKLNQNLKNDEADALAIAICHLQSYKVMELRS